MNAHKNTVLIGIAGVVLGSAFFCGFQTGFRRNSTAASQKLERTREILRYALTLIEKQREEIRRLNGAHPDPETTQADQREIDGRHASLLKAWRKFDAAVGD